MPIYQEFEDYSRTETRKEVIGDDELPQEGCSTDMRASEAAILIGATG